MLRKLTLTTLLIWLAGSWTSAHAADPNECIRQGREYMFEKTLSGLRLAYRTFDECLSDPSCADCASSDELVFLHSLTRAAMLFIDTNDLVVNDSFLELAEAFGLLVTGDSLDPCGINPVDVNVLMDLDGCYRIPAGAPDLNGLRNTLDYSIIPEIDNIVAELETIPDSQTEPFRMFFEPNETGLQKDLEVDYGEVLIVKGLLLAFRSALTAQLAYDVYLDVNDTRIESLLYSEGICPNDVNSLEPSDFIDLKDPNNPSINEDFLVPYPDLLKVLPTAGYPDVNGAAILAQSAVDLIDAIDYYQQAVAYIIAEDQPPGTDPQEDELFYVDPNERRLLDSINARLATLRDSLAKDTVGTYPLETTRTYEVQEPNSAKIGELVLVYDALDTAGEDGTLSFTKSGLAPSPWQVEWFDHVDSNQLHVELERFADGQYMGGFLLGTITADSNTITDATFEYWGAESGTISGLTALHTGTKIVDGRLDVNPLFGGSDRYPNPVNPRDLLAEFDWNNEPISGTFGHRLGDDPTLGGIFPDMTQELWAMLLDLPVPGLRFEAGFRLPVGARPVSAVLADLNGDGFPDIITANADSDDVSVLLSDGNGGFLPEQYYGAGAGPVSVAVGDLNGDRIPDVVVANEDSYEVSVLMGLGDGRLQRQSRHAAGIQPSGVAVGDVTGDGIADVVTSNKGFSNVCVLPGVGNGDLGPPTFVTVGEGPASVALGDLNWDGILDIVTVDDWSGTISVLLAKGDGQFDERRSLQAGGGPASVALGDLNNDGTLDIVAGNAWSDDVTVALGKGDGNFEDPTSFNTQEGQFSVALWDVNGDGITDIVTANTWDTQISVLLGVGDGTFGRRSGFDVGDDPQCVLVGDLDVDGVAEILTANGRSDDVSVFVSISTTYGHYPSGSVPAPVDGMRFHFPYNMKPDSFSLEQDIVSFVGPLGPIEANSYRWLSRRTLEVGFQPQHEYGIYRMVLGPDILDAFGRPLDVDNDKVFGEVPDDRYIAAFRLLLGTGDLIVSDVNVQGTPLAGRPLHVAWDVKNQDPNSTTKGGFVDAIYLSENTDWDMNDMYLGKAMHDDPLEPNETSHQELDVILPGVLPGDYYVLVRTDAGNRVDEPNAEDNNVTASTPVSVDVDELLRDVPAIDELTADVRARYFKFNVTEEKDLEISLDSLSDNSATELYVMFGAIPTRNRFDYRHATDFAADHKLVIPNPLPGTYYILVYAGRIPASGSLEFALTAAYLPFGIRSVTPLEVGNTNYVTFTVNGAGFTADTQFKLITSDAGQRDPLDLFVYDSTVADVIFDLSEAPPGNAWIEPLQSAQLASPEIQGAGSASEMFPLQIVGGAGSAFVLTLAAPSEVRVGTGFSLSAHVQNVGLVDSPPFSLHISIPEIAPINKVYGPLSPDEEIDLTIPVVFSTPGCKLMVGRILSEEECQELKSRIRSNVKLVQRLRVEYLLKLGQYEACKQFQTQPPWCLRLKQELNRLRVRIEKACEFLKAVCQNFPSECGLAPDECDKVNDLCVPLPAMLEAPFGQGCCPEPGASTILAPSLLMGAAGSEDYEARDTATVCVIGSWDPNKKIGPAGFGALGYVTGDRLFTYTIYFENEPNASAAALSVSIVDQLDPNLDWTTFEPIEVSFGEHGVVVPEGMSHFESNVQIDGWTYTKDDGWHTGGAPLTIDINADIDIGTGRATWNLRTYDSNTGWEPEDPYAGFLPPDDPDDATGRGEGSVTFTIRPRAGLPAATEITNSASIVFDTNPPIETDPVVNTIVVHRADFDLSGDVALGDLTRLAEQWLWVGSPGYVYEDITGDGVVNFPDFAQLAETFMK
ncbi:MAG: VCBS repeat-containing protein [Phycisphaerales bacterium]|nr:MAG: VCBS repeat-containing protein [Phycisphaerales bacterium]